MSARRRVSKPSSLLPVWAYAGFAAVWVGGCFSYLIWTEQAGKDLRSKGIMKDILREEERIKACKDCDAMNLKFQVMEKGEYTKYDVVLDNVSSSSNEEGGGALAVDDRLTQLACLRQGIELEELQPIESVADFPIPKEFESMRWEHFEKRQQAKVSLIRAERASLVRKLKRLSTRSATAGQLGTELLMHCAAVLNKSIEDLTPSDADMYLPISPYDERVAAHTVIRDTVSTVKANLVYLNMPTNTKYSEEAQKYREIELRNVYKEQKLAKESDALYMNAEAQSKRMHEQEQQRKEDIARHAQQSQREHQMKMLRLRNLIQERSEAKSSALHQVVRRRNERDELRKREKTEKQMQHIKASEQRMALVKERQELVEFALRQRTELQRTKLEHKLELHDQRCKSLVLQREKDREVQKIEKICHRASMAKYRKMQQQESEGASLSVFVKMEDSAQRVASLKRFRSRVLQERKREMEETAKAAEMRRTKNQLELVRHTNSLLMSKVKKEVYLQQVQEEKEKKKSLNKELKLQRLMCARDNKKRLGLMREYKHSVAATMVSQEINREATRKEAERRQARQREEALKTARLEKERIRQEIRERHLGKKLAYKAPLEVDNKEDAKDPCPLLLKEPQCTAGITPVAEILNATAEVSYATYKPFCQVSAPQSFDEVILRDTTKDYLTGKKILSIEDLFPPYCRYTMDIQKIQDAIKPSGAAVKCHAADFLEENNLDEHMIKSWTTMTPTPNPLIAKFPRMSFHDENDAIVANIVSHQGKIAQKTVRRAGPTPTIMWNPADVRAGIVTCGGLCPGLNSIIRDITVGLYANYGLRTPGSIIGFRNGYNGFDTIKYPPVVLTPALVEEIHTKGGSILGAGRGGFDPDFIVDTLLRLGVNHLYVVGGDGTQWAADIIFQVVKERGLKMSIIGIPKTIDNDILFFDRSFGFHSAVDASVAAIRSAFVEASSCHNGVGIVKLMGRDSGFVARNAALASNLTDAVLIPEVDFEFEGKAGLLEHIVYRVRRKGHAVIVVAEGAGQKLCATNKKDETGHTVYGDIGNLLKERVGEHLKKTIGGRCFFIDPSYMIRSIPATPNDNIFCARMAHEAVHAAMRGYSGICVGSVHDYMVIVPMKDIATGRRMVNVNSSIWQRLCEATGMPDSLTGQDKKKAILTRKKRGTPEMFRAKKRRARL